MPASFIYHYGTAVFKIFLCCKYVLENKNISIDRDKLEYDKLFWKIFESQVPISQTLFSLLGIVNLLRS